MQGYVDIVVQLLHWQSFEMLYIQEIVREATK